MQLLFDLVGGTDCFGAVFGGLGLAIEPIAGGSVQGANEDVGFFFGHMELKRFLMDYCAAIALKHLQQDWAVISSEEE